MSCVCVRVRITLYIVETRNKTHPATRLLDAEHVNFCFNKIKNLFKYKCMYEDFCG